MTEMQMRQERLEDFTNIVKGDKHYPKPFCISGQELETLSTSRELASRPSHRPTDRSWFLFGVVGVAFLPAQFDNIFPLQTHQRQMRVQREICRVQVIVQILNKAALQVLLSRAHVATN